MESTSVTSIEWLKIAGAAFAQTDGSAQAMTEAITSQGVNIAQATARTTEEQNAVNTFDVEITGVEQLRHVLKSLERVKGIISVERVRS